MAEVTEINYKDEYPLVSVIIPSYNRFELLLNAVESVKAQTYKNIEIIIVNDCSTDTKYTTHSFGEGVSILHQNVNSRQLLGFGCAGYMRTIGMQHATGHYIAFLDDDDIWFSKKLELQIAAMKHTGCKMSSTDGLIGDGPYNPSTKYEIYNGEHCHEILRNIFESKGSNLIKDGFPAVWNRELLLVHNCCITSSVIIEKSILEKINYMRVLPNGKEDYDCWLRATEHTNSVYVSDVCFYYDQGLSRARNDGR